MRVAYSSTKESIDSSCRAARRFEVVVVLSGRA
jgi:hypothetical protein